MNTEYVNRWEKPLINLALNKTDDGGNMRYRVRLTKLVSEHKNLRTDIVVGYANQLPEVGSRFFMVAESLTIGFPMAVRIIETTTVLNIERIGKEFLFNTENSTYKLEVLSGGEFGYSSVTQ